MSHPLETRFLLVAVILAEELSFTRAAKRLKMSQSGVSRSLNELERRCGFKLFNRDHASVVITDAGRAFVEEAKLSLIHHERAIASGKAANEGIESHLIIGRSPYLDPVIISALFSVRLPLYPNLVPQMQSDFSPDLLYGLLTRKLDLAFVANPSPNPKITMVKIMGAPFYIAIPENHPVASKDSLTLEDLRGCTWIVFERKVHPVLHDAICRRAIEQSVTYKNNQNVLSADEAFQLVAENVGIAFLTKASALRTRRPGISVRPLVDKELRVELWLASRADNKSKLASEFVRAFMKRIEPILAPPQMLLPLTEAAFNPRERMTAKRQPKSEMRAGELNARKIRSRKPKSH
jgi:DNA-binding transcriptional LysR family regulator